jgi:hypothetical protein
VSYVARPALLLWVQPRPQFADNIADPRLAVLGYDRGGGAVLPPVVLGLWVYAGVVVAYAIWDRGHHGAARSSASPADLTPTLWTVYVLGLLGRIVSFATGSTGAAGDLHSPNPFLSFAAQLASIGALGLIIFLRPAQRRATVAVIGAMLAVELLWTVAVESKTPIMSAALAVGLRFALAGWTRVRVIGIAAITIVGLHAFGWLQSIKEPEHLSSAGALADSSYPPTVQPYLSILRRFDLLAAATDSYYMGGRPWLTPGEVLENSLRSLVPAQLLSGDKLMSGTAWAAQVRGSSRDMTRVSVSLAEGNINEGFVLGGNAGVVAGVLFTFVLLLLVVRALQARHILFVSLGLALSAPPALFERGILGSMEVIGKALQLAVLIWFIDMAVREYRRRTEPSPQVGPASPHIGTPVAVPAKG